MNRITIASDIIPFYFDQPMPIDFGIQRVPGSDYRVLTRQWNPGDPLRCRLCPRGECAVLGLVCTLIIRRDIRDEDAPLFDTTDLTRS